MALFCCLVLFVLPSHSQPGAIDSSFGTSGKVVSGIGAPWNLYFTTMVLQKDGKLVVGGDSINYTGNDYEYTNSFALQRYNTDGTLDKTFGTKGTFRSPMPVAAGGYADMTSMAIQKDGKIITGGYDVWDYSFHLTRHLSNGTIDKSFGVNGICTFYFGTGGETFLSRIAVQDDGRIIAVGSFDGYCIARCLPNGIVDSSFGVNGMMTTFSRGSISDVAVSKDGKIYISVNCKSTVLGWPYNLYYNQFEVDRLLPNGDMDETFGDHGAAITSIADTLGNDYPTSLALLDNGDILQAGYNQNGDALVKYKANGTLDASFGKNGIKSPVFGIAGLSRVLVQPDAKILFGNTYLGRLLANGTVDAAYGVNGKVYNSGGFQSMLLLPDGKVLSHSIPYTIVTRFRGDATPVNIK